MTEILYRASELGGCSKFLVLKRLGFEAMDPPKEFKEKYFEAGKAAEQEVYDLLASGGEIVTDFQREVNIHIDGGVYVQGHIDGILDDRVLEIKSMSELEWKRFKKDRWSTSGLVQRYKWQISCYMVALDSEAMVVIYNRETGELLREGVEVPWYGVDDIRERVLGIEGWVSEGNVPEECDFSNYPCPFYYLHEGVEREIEENEEMDTLAFWYEDLRQQEKQIKDNLSTIRGEIIKVLGDRVQLSTNRIQVSLSDVVSKRFDKDKARKDGVEVDRYMVETKSQRLNVKIETDGMAMGAEAEADDGE